MDTLNYLKQFEANKYKYTGQAFSVLLSDMKFAKPQKIWIIPIHAKRKSVNETIFCFNTKCAFAPDNAGCLAVTWKEPLSFKSYFSAVEKNNQSFMEEEKLFFDSVIVKDIQIYRR